MLRTYEAILTGDRIQWIGEAPKLGASTRVYVTVLATDESELPSRPQSDGRAAAAALEELAKLNAFESIKDPVEWQREIRKDRPLPGRD